MYLYSNVSGKTGHWTQAVPYGGDGARFFPAPWDEVRMRPQPALLVLKTQYVLLNMHEY